MHTKPWSEDLLDFLAVQFAKDGYDLRKFLKFVLTSEAYGSQTDRLESLPGEEYVYTAPVPKRMTAEQLMDTIWQVTGTNPNQPEAKVDRSTTTAPSSVSGSKDLPKIEKVTAKWIWAPDPQTRKIKLRTSIDLEKQPAFTSLLATCDNAFSLRVNGKFVTSSREWTRPAYHEVSDFFKAGKNLIEVNAEMFGGGSGFIAQFSFGKEKDVNTLVTDQNWEVQQDKKWIPAKAFHKYGAGPWKRILDQATPTKPGQSAFDGPSVRAALVKNDFLMRSLGRPHRDQVVTSRPAELTMLQAIDLANGAILSKYLNEGANNLKAKATNSQQFINWLYEHTLGRLPTNGEEQIIASVMTDPKDTQQVEDLLWLVFMQPDFQIIR